LIHIELLLIVTVSLSYRYPVPVPVPVGRILKIAIRYIPTSYTDKKHQSGARICDTVTHADL